MKSLLNTLAKQLQLTEVKSNIEMMRGNICISSLFLKLLILVSLSGCAAYKNKFECGTAAGVNCRSVEDIYAMTQSGEVWRYNGATSKCKGKKCSVAKEEDRIAANDGIIKVWIPKNYRQEKYKDGQYWYIPSQDENTSIESF